MPVAKKRLLVGYRERGDFYCLNHPPPGVMVYVYADQVSNDDCCVECGEELNTTSEKSYQK